MLNCLAQGKLTADPKMRTATNGNPYATALLKVDTADGSILVSIIAFPPAAAQLAYLRAGDSAAVTGEGKLTSWAKGGTDHKGLAITASEVLTLYQARAKRAAATTADAAKLGLIE